MAKAWKRIKVWLIKKLGGYTAEEVNVRYEFFPQPTKNIIDLRAEGTFLCYNAPPKEFVEDRLIRELAEQLKPHVLWEESVDYMDFIKAKKTVRATAKVVAVNG